MVQLSPATRERLVALFKANDVSEAERLLAEDCAEGLPPVGEATPMGLERIRFAALRTSDGELNRLRDAIRLANTDWRDLLVAAGFAGDVDAHKSWWPGRPR